jgi:hypothetical protein
MLTTLLNYFSVFRTLGNYYNNNDWDCHKLLVLCRFATVNFQLGAIAPLIEIGIRRQKKLSRAVCYGLIALIGLGLRLFTFLTYETYFDGDLTQ